MDNPLRSLSAKTQILHDSAMVIKALSPQNQNSAETGRRALNHRVDGIHCDGSQSRFHLDGEFLRSVALFTVD
jgi:hypothetical protein